MYPVRSKDIRMNKPIRQQAVYNKFGKQQKTRKVTQVGLSPRQLGVRNYMSSASLNKVFPKAHPSKSKTKTKEINNSLKVKQSGKYNKILSKLEKNDVNNKHQKDIKTALTIQKLNDIYKTKNRKNVKETNSSMNFKFITHNVTGDGHCLFRSIAQSLQYSKNKKTLPLSTETKRATALRKKALKEVCKNKGNNKPASASPVTYRQSILTELKFEYGQTSPNIFDTYCKCQKGKARNVNKCTPSKVFRWGGFNEIVALSKLLKRLIVVYVRKSANSYDKVNVNTLNVIDDRPIHVVLVGDNHYKALFPKNF